MSWKKEIDELKNREKLAEKMGGKEKLKRQKDNNRLNVRQRIKLLADKNSFHEIGKIAGKAEYDDKGKLKKFVPSNFILGRAKINGKRGRRHGRDDVGCATRKLTSRSVVQMDASVTASDSSFSDATVADV